MESSFLKQTLSVLFVVCILLLPAATATAQQQAADVVTVGTGSATPGGTLAIPVSIRDVSGTPLGIDQPPGSRIQSYAITVNYAPASAVQSISFSRAGITAGLTPAFESKPTAPGSVTLIDTFSESTNLIPFTLNAPAPGNQVGQLLVTLAPGATPGTTITLTLDTTLTQLANEGGTIKETTTLGTLQLVNGAVTVLTPVDVPTLGLTLLGVLIVALGIIAIRLRM